MKLIKVEIREIRRKSIKMLNLVLPINLNLVDVIISKKIHGEIINICLNDDISVKNFLKKKYVG